MPRAGRRAHARHGASVRPLHQERIGSCTPDQRIILAALVTEATAHTPATVPHTGMAASVSWHVTVTRMERQTPT